MWRVFAVIFFFSVIAVQPSNRAIIRSLFGSVTDTVFFSIFFIFSCATAASFTHVAV